MNSQTLKKHQILLLPVLVLAFLFFLYTKPVEAQGPECSIDSFTADDPTPNYKTSTTLRFSLSGSFPWSIDLIPGDVIEDEGGGSSPTEVPFLTSMELGSMRNDYGGWVGMAITVGSDPITVTSLGRIIAPDNSENHEVKIVDADTGDDLASVIVDPTLGSVGTFAYTSFDDPVTLGANKNYYILSHEVHGGDNWYDVGTEVSANSVADVLGGVYGGGSPYNLVSSPNHEYVPVDFIYESESEEVIPSPDLAPSCDAPGNNAFTACYYSSPDLTNLAIEKTESYPLYLWWGDGFGSPDPSIPNDGFSAIFEGNFDFTGNYYTFSAGADDGVRLYVDNQLLIDKWQNQPDTTYTATKYMSNGTHLVRMEYYEFIGEAVSRLSWVNNGSASGTGDSGSYNTPVIKETQTYRLSCGSAIQDLSINPVFPPPTPTPDPIYMIPDSLGDSARQIIGKKSPDKILGDVFADAGFADDDMIDQKQYQRWTMPFGTTTLEVEYLGSSAAIHHVFGYYPDGDISQFVPVFRPGDFPELYPEVPILGGPGTVISVTVGPMSNIIFGIRSATEDFTTESSKNSDGLDHALAFDAFWYDGYGNFFANSDDYLIGFEDIGGLGDADYNDMVVRVHGVATPVVGAPTVDLSAAPLDGNPPLTTNLSWTTTNDPTSCTADASPVIAGWSGAKNTAGDDQDISNITNTTTFILTCSNEFGEGSDSIMVTPTGSGPGYDVNVTKTGGGAVQSLDGDIHCGEVCNANYAQDTDVILQAVPNSSWLKFSGWSGDCTGTGNCVLNIDGPKDVHANFELRSLFYKEL